MGGRPTKTKQKGSISSSQPTDKTTQQPTTQKSIASLSKQLHPSSSLDSYLKLTFDDIKICWLFQFSIPLPIEVSQLIVDILIEEISKQQTRRTGNFSFQFLLWFYFLFLLLFVLLSFFSFFTFVSLSLQSSLPIFQSIVDI